MCVNNSDWDQCNNGTIPFSEVQQLIHSFKMKKIPVDSDAPTLKYIISFLRFAPLNQAFDAVPIINKKGQRTPSPWCASAVS
jgi:hypothetical protein